MGQACFCRGLVFRGVPGINNLIIGAVRKRPQSLAQPKSVPNCAGVFFWTEAIFLGVTSRGVCLFLCRKLGIWCQIFSAPYFALPNIARPPPSVCHPEVHACLSHGYELYVLLRYMPPSDMIVLYVVDAGPTETTTNGRTACQFTSPSCSTRFWKALLPLLGAAAGSVPSILLQVVPLCHILTTVDRTVQTQGWRERLREDAEWEVPEVCPFVPPATNSEVPTPNQD